jgi:SAM-dependent methyltransferase
MAATELDRTKLEELGAKITNHAAGAMGVLLAYIGDQLGLYRALAERPMTSEELAAQTGTEERYVREWLSSNAAGGYVEYDISDQKFSMTPEQALLFAAEGKPGCMQGFFQTIIAAYLDEPKCTEVFRTGEGIPWGDKHACCFCGTERFFRPMYEASLIDEWLPALRGVTDKLAAGAVVGDIGCGHGISTMLMARAYPSSTFYGFDYHGPSIEEARRRAHDAGVGANTHFEVADAKSFPSHGYDLVAIFDALHDMGDPVGAARHVRSTLKPGGTFMVVEPRAGDSLVDNLHPLGQAYYAFSTLTCTAVSRSQEVGLALGAQAGPALLIGVLEEAGFSDIRLAAEGQTNILLEAVAG